jgi:hypothetical protein
VTEYEDLENVSSRRKAAPGTRGRLVNCARSLPQRGSELLEAGRLEKDEPVGELE